MAPVNVLECQMGVSVHMALDVHVLGVPPEEATLPSSYASRTEFAPVGLGALGLFGV